METTAKTMPQRFVARVFDDLHMKANKSLAVRAAAEKLLPASRQSTRLMFRATVGQFNIGDLMGWHSTMFDASTAQAISGSTLSLADLRNL
jgi:hypothetical protein